jgi:hypothetical protein
VTGSLRSALDRAMAETGCTMNDLTVLAPKNDPFRVADTPAGHRDGEWLAATMAGLGLGSRRIHPRGLHYMIAMGEAVKPDGLPYINNDADWAWLSERAVKCARYNGCIPWDQIEDHRNDAPVVRRFEPPEPYAYLSTSVTVSIPADVEPVLWTEDFRGVQPYKIVLVGEKSSLEPVLGPVASQFEADLYLPAGCMSDTLTYQIAATAIEDGRPLVVLYFADCDPAGWNMPIEVGRKLQAFHALLGGFEFDLYRVALTPGQVRLHGLPSTPLKDTELRADHWQRAMGVRQTEIDALAALQPDLLRQLARQALSPFYDRGLEDRVERYRRDWEARAWRRVEPTLQSDRLAEIRAEAQRKLAEMRSQVADLNRQLRVDIDRDDLPLIELPEPELDAAAPEPLISSGWSFAEQCQALIRSRQYEEGGA